MTISTVTETDLEKDQTYHSFDPAIAKQVGVQAAVVFYNLAFWIGENRKHGRNYHDGRHWTYNSLKAYSEQYDYLSEKQIRTALDKSANVCSGQRGN